MKKFWKYAVAATAIAVALPLASCDDNDSTDPYTINYVYCYSQDNEYSTLEFKNSGAIIEDIDDPLDLVPIRLTKPAPSGFTAEIAIDPALVDEYNSANGTNYKLLEGVSIVNPNISIEKGQYISTEPIQLSFLDRSGLTNVHEDLILPVVIKHATGGVQISKSSRIFIVFKYKANFVSIGDASLELGTDQSTWASQLANLKFDNFFNALWAAEEDITLTAEIDNSLVDDYNKANGSDFVAWEGASLKSTTFTIPEGQSSLALALNAGSTDKMASNGYVVPVRLTAATGSGAEVDPDHSIAYIVVCPAIPSLEYVTTAPGTEIAYTSGMSMTVNGSADAEDGTPWTSLLSDPGNGSADYWVAGDVVVVDLGETKTVTGVKTEFFAWYYSIRSYTSVYTSVDGVEWKNWKEVNFTPETWGEFNPLYFKFSFPIDCRYIKMTVGTASYDPDEYGTFPTGIIVYE